MDLFDIDLQWTMALLMALLFSLRVGGIAVAAVN
jgi:hypothetical protein